MTNEISDSLPQFLDLSDPKEKLPPLALMVDEAGAPRKKGQWRRKRRWPQHRVAGVLTCEYCKKQYNAKTYQIRRKQRFCSGDCRWHLSEIDRFWKFVDKSEHPKGCWIWTGSKVSGRYGHSTWGRRPALAHRVSYIIAKGSIPEDMVVCHKCDNVFCVNPEHLFVGTQRDNVYDMVSKGRNQTNVLTKEQKIEIHRSKIARDLLAEQYSVSIRTIADIQNSQGVYSWLKEYTSDAAVVA